MWWPLILSLLYYNEISDQKYIVLSAENDWKLPLVAVHTSVNALYAITVLLHSNDAEFVVYFIWSFSMFLIDSHEDVYFYKFFFMDD